MILVPLLKPEVRNRTRCELCANFGFAALELRTVGSFRSVRVIGKRTAALAGASCVLAALATARATTGIVISDSLGVGFAEVSHLKNFARNSVHIRGPKALDQIRGAPQGWTAFVVLGTNDAEGSITNLDKSIDDILGAAAKKHMRVVWIGPPCVHRPWDTRARELDKMLATKLPPRGVTYVPMRASAFCAGGLHEPDGVHLKTKGYAYMWDKARRVAGLDTTGSIMTAAAAPSKPAASRGAAAQAPNAKFELAAAPAAAASGGSETDAPKVYVLRVKRGGGNGTN
jgi:hypothetical protein